MKLNYKNAQLVTRGLINPWLLKLFGQKQYDLANTLLVIGCYRGGTTWLAELVASIPNSGMVFEPTQIINVPQAREAGFYYRTYVESEQPWLSGYEFVEKVLQGRMISRWTVSNIPISQVLSVDRWVVKMLGSNTIVEWLLDNFPIKAPVMIIRHPCAILASQLGRGWEHCSIDVFNDDGFLKAYPEYQKAMAQVKTPIELYAARWCIDQIMPLKASRRHNIHFVCYEHMIREGVKDLAPVFLDWEIAMPQALEAKFHDPSAKVSSDFNAGVASLGKWQKRLAQEHIDSVLRIVKAFGLDFYTYDPEPDYARLLGENALGKPVS